MLHRRVFAGSAAPAGPTDSYRKYFSEVFLHQARQNALSSLVHERNGVILGFLGVVPRPMRFNGQPILAAVCSQFVVDPSERGIIGLQMLKHCFAGPQDLSLTDEAGDNTRKMWEWCGGSVALPLSLHWIRPLRPAQTLVVAGRNAGFGRVVRPLGLVARILDVIARPQMHRSVPGLPRGSREPLDEATLLKGLREFAGTRAILPDYDMRSLTQILERADRRAGSHRMHKRLVRDEAGRHIGWFVYAETHEQIGEVLQMASDPRSARQVLDHLVADARQAGMIALSGRLEPAFGPELSENHFLAYRRGYWTLAHARDRELLHAFQRGDAFFSRLEGEWCLRYQ